MKKAVTRLLALSLLALPAGALADTSIHSTTMFHLFQDSRTGFPEKRYAPATQFLGVDVDKLGDGNLSLHLYGWGRLDLADKSYNDSQPEGSLTYGYAQYRLDQANGQARLGRLLVTEGVANEYLDGLSVSTDLPYGFGISAFGGATVRTANLPGEQTDGKGDGILGGRVSYRRGGRLELGLSGVYESSAPTLQNRQLAADGKFGSHRLIGGDLWLAPHRMVDLMGRTSFNTETGGVAEHSYLVNVRPTNDLSLSLEYDEQRERDLFYSSIFFAGLVQSLNDRSRSMGGRASYQLNKATELTGDYKHYRRDLGEADRFGGELRWSLMDRALRTGAGYHYLRSSREFAVVPSSGASGSFHELRGFAMYSGKKYFASLDAIGFLFKEGINNRPSALELIGSLGYHLTPSLSLSGDLSYGRNPQFLDELQGVVRLSYNMNYSAKGASK
jgi:hypothetical protein